MNVLSEKLDLIEWITRLDDISVIERFILIEKINKGRE